MTVVLLLACDGTNGSTTFTDESPSAKTVTVFGNAQVSTAQSKFGGASAKFDGTGDYLSLANSPDWDVAGDYTAEFWFRTDVASGASFTKGIAGTGPAGAGWAVGHYQGKMSLRIKSTSYDGAGTIATNTWYHVALVWNGASFKCYLDGVEIYSGTAEAIDTSSALIIGNFSPIDANRYLQGYVDDVCLQDTAVYTANFTPPTLSHAADRTGLVSTAGPLGAATGLGAVMVSGYAADTGPLQQPSVYGQHLFGFAAAAGPLGAPAVYGSLVFAWCSDPGPLQQPALLAVHDFTDAIAGLRTRYVMDLVTPGGDVRAPISTWQATLRTGVQSYVQCNVPAAGDWVDDLNAATEFVIWRQVTLTTGETIEYEMARAPVDSLSLAQGPRNYTATLTGYADGFAENASPPEATDRTLANVRSVFTASSGMRVRCAIDWLLRPGQRAYSSGTAFIVGRISYFAGDGDEYMDVGEVADA